MMNVLLTLLWLACGPAHSAASTQTWTLVHKPEVSGRAFERFVPRGGVIFALPGVSVSRDGGRAWEERESMMNHSGAAFASEDAGIAVFDPISRLERTNDGGRKWAPVKAQPELLSVMQFWFFDDKNGFGLGSDGMLVTRDGGLSWAEHSKPTGASAPDGRAVFVLDDKNAWIAYGIQEVRVLRTSDGGKTWISAQISGLKDAAALCFGDSLHGWLLADRSLKAGPSLWSTIDGGKTWSKTGVPQPGTVLTSAACRGASKVWVAGPGRLAESSDGGESWSAVAGPPTSGAEGVGLRYGAADDGEYLLIGTNEPEVTGTPDGVGEDKPQVFPAGAIYRLKLGAAAR